MLYLRVYTCPVLLKSFVRTLPGVGEGDVQGMLVGGELLHDSKVLGVLRWQAKDVEGNNTKRGKESLSGQRRCHYE